MKRRLSMGYLFCCMILFIASILLNADYFYKLAYDNLILYQIKQVCSILVLYIIGYLFLKSVQSYFNEIWLVLLSVPCGVALWVFAGQFLFMCNITYMMHRVLIGLVLMIIVCHIIRIKTGHPVKGMPVPAIDVILVVTGTALMVSTGWNYINMNYDSYLYFADYGKMMAIAGDYREWNTSNAFVITNVGQFLPTLNSYTAFWGLDSCIPIQSFLTLNMVAIFGVGIYDMQGEQTNERKKIWYSILFTVAMATCTCIVVFANWMLSNAFIMYYLLIAGILGMRSPGKAHADYMLVISGCSLAITMLRKDGMILVCFLFICYCCNKIISSRWLALLFLPSIAMQLYYIGYVRIFLRTDAHTARGTSLLNNTFVAMLAAAAVITLIYILFLHRFFEKWLKQRIYLFILAGMIIAVLGAILLKFSLSVDHIDAVFHVLVSPAYGFSLLSWLVLLAAVLVTRPKIDYSLFLIIGYCLLTFLIYWNKGNTEQGIDNSGMRTFVQVVPLIYYVAAYQLKDIIKWRN